MGKHRLAAKVDANQKQIVKDLRSIPGLSVDVGHDDILVGFNGKTYWFEIKNPEKSKKEKKQKELEIEWCGHYQIVYSFDEILKCIGVIK